MTAKFYDDQDMEKSIEFSEEHAHIFIQCNSINGVILSEEELLYLIDFLWLVQANLKRKSNGRE